jgi:hypothetical protein
LEGERVVRMAMCGMILRERRDHESLDQRKSGPRKARKGRKRERGNEGLDYERRERDKNAKGATRDRTTKGVKGETKVWTTKGAKRTKARKE